jgi:hypothetical protein
MGSQLVGQTLPSYNDMDKIFKDKGAVRSEITTDKIDDNVTETTTRFFDSDGKLVGSKSETSTGTGTHYSATIGNLKYSASSVSNAIFGRVDSTTVISNTFGTHITQRSLYAVDKNHNGKIDEGEVFRAPADGNAWIM